MDEREELFYRILKAKLLERGFTHKWEEAEARGLFDLDPEFFEVLEDPDSETYFVVPVIGDDKGHQEAIGPESYRQAVQEAYTEAASQFERGLFGFFGHAPDPALLREVTREAARRGPHAFGYARASDEGAVEYRAAGHLAQHLEEVAELRAGAIIGHARLVTGWGDWREARNNQPVRAGPCQPQRCDRERGSACRQV